MRVAANGRAVAVAWLEAADDGKRSEIHLSLFDRRLRPRDDVRLATIERATSVGIAPTPAGWMIAASGRGGILVLSVSPTGELRSPTRRIPGDWLIQLVGRPGGGPLLLMDRQNDIEALLLTSNGEPGWLARPFPSGSGVVEAAHGSAVFVGDGFLVAMRAGPVTIARIELDGRVSQTSVPGRPQTEWPRLAWLGSEGALTWAEFGSHFGVWWARIDRTGRRVGDSIRIGALPNFNLAPIAASSAESAVVLAGYASPNGASSLDIARVDRTGQLVRRQSITRDGIMHGHQVVSLGSDVVVAWITQPAGHPSSRHGERFTLMRLTP
jgi:hypothetical protein